MQKYTFDMVCTEDIVGGDPRYKRINLVGNVNGEEKTIKLCGPHIGTYGIFKKKWTRLFSTMG